MRNKINKQYLYGYVFALILGSFQYGFALSSMNPIMRIIVRIYHWENDADVALYSGLISTITPFGGLIGASFTGIFAESERRKIILYFNILIISGSVILQIQNIFTLIAGRFILGLGIGIDVMITPKIIREISPKKIAGLVGTLHQFMSASGIAITMVLTIGIPKSNEGIESNQIWRVVFLFPIVISSIQLSLFFTIFNLDTPYFYFTKEDQSKLVEVFESIYRSNDEKETALNDIETLSKSTLKSKKIKLIDLISGKYLKPLIVGVSLNIFQQASGNNVINFYSSSIFSNHGKYNPDS